MRKAPNRAGLKDALLRWDDYRKNVERLTEVSYQESEGDKLARVARLKGDFEAFCKYYYPQYYSAAFAPFHLRFAKKVINNKVLYAVWALAREHAKSVISGLFLPTFEMVNGRMKNMLMVSHSYDNACELLMPLMINLESNQRLLNDFGNFKTFRGWEVGRFVTGSGCSFRALGAGQSPRGSRNEEKRPDFILIDDIDTDEECRNQARVDKKWAWVEQALFPTMSISGSKRFLVVGNIIAKDSIVVKASKVADYFDKVNILDKNGKPSWSERYKMEDVNYMLSKISYASGQKEYFNNPINPGTVFKDIIWDKVPPLSKFRFVVAYCDPSYKASKTSDFKGIPLVGEYQGNFYVLTCFLEQTTVANMIGWYYHLDEWVAGRAAIYNYIEAGSLQDTFYTELFLPQLVQAGKARGKHLSISPDHRSKPDKFTRIEATLEPLNRQGRLIFNIAEEKNPHMQRLEEQMKAIEPALGAHDDGPDALEGAVWMLNNKLRLLEPIKVGKDRRSKYKY
jgi:hypothetical protein